MAEFAETAHEKAESAGGKRQIRKSPGSIVRAGGEYRDPEHMAPFRCVMWQCQCGIVRGKFG